jgi:acetyl esterase/lipase
MRFRFLAASSLLALCCALPGRAADRPQMVDLWPGKAPGETAEIGEEKDTSKPGEGLVAGKPLIRLGNVSKPTLAIYRPSKEKDTGAAVVIAPGGGYSILALDLEGSEVAEWLNTLGVTGIVLKYRVPTRASDPTHQLPLQDAQRAISVVRSRAGEWGLDPSRIGLLGFSAGGHLAAATATNFDRRGYEALDDADKASCRPDFLVLVYPAYMVSKENPDRLATEVRVTKDTPPTFLVHAGNDPVTAESSALFFLALKRAKVPAELHIYPSGGHGYGLRKTDEPVTGWPVLCADWLRRTGVLKKSAREG